VKPSPRKACTISHVPPTLLRDPEFLKFWSGQSISLVGSQFTLLALPIAAAVTLRATSAEMGVLTALQSTHNDQRPAAVAAFNTVTDPT
jgi:hypothetical protein